MDLGALSLWMILNERTVAQQRFLELVFFVNTLSALHEGRLFALLICVLKL